MSDSQTDNDEKFRAIAAVLPGAFYAGPTKLKYLNDGEGEWHVVSIRTPNGRGQSILCRTQEQAEMIARMAQAAEAGIRESA